MNMSVRARFIVLVVLLGLSALSSAQSHASLLASHIRKETAIPFTHTTKYSKQAGAWSCIVLTVKPKDAVTDNATAMGLLYKKGKKWIVVDYVLGTAMEGTIKEMQRKSYRPDGTAKIMKPPATIFPKKL